MRRWPDKIFIAILVLILGTLTVGPAQASTAVATSAGRSIAGLAAAHVTPLAAGQGAIGSAVVNRAKGKFTGVSVKVTGLPKGAKASMRITQKVKKRTKTVRNLQTSGGRFALKPGRYALVTPSLTHNGTTYLPAEPSVAFRVRAKKTTGLTAAYRIGSGTLSVTATGLPIGAEARIRIVGNGTDETVQAVSLNRELQAGQYRIEALPVDFQGSQATPVTPPQTVVVEAGRPTALTVAYQYADSAASAVPGRVAQIQADPAQNEVKLTWTQASAPPDAPVSSHRVTIWKNDTKVDTKTTGAGQSMTVKVTGGQRYRFAVAAGNANGFGEESPVSLEVIPILMEYKAGVALVDPLTVVSVDGTSDTGGTVTVTGTAPADGATFVIEPSSLVPGGLTGRVQYVNTNGEGQKVISFAPVSSLDAVIEDYKIDVKNVPITGAPAQQALSARQYMDEVRDIQQQPKIKLGCEGLVPLEFDVDISKDLAADWDEKYFKVLLRGNLGVSVDFQKALQLGGTWTCSISIPGGTFFIGSFQIDQEFLISASVVVPFYDAPGGDAGLDLAVQAGFEKNGGDVTNLSDVSATPRWEPYGDGTDVSMDSTASASLKQKYKGRFLGVAGLAMSAGPSLSATLHEFPTAECYELSVGYDIGVSIELGKWGVEWSMELFNATVFEKDLVDTCDKVWTGPVDVKWGIQSERSSCPWSYVCGWYPPPPDVLDKRTRIDQYTLHLGSEDPTKRSQPGVGNSPARITGTGTEDISITRYDYLNGTGVPSRWCDASVQSTPESVAGLERKYAISLSPIERVGPGRMRWYVGVNGVSGSPIYPGETGSTTSNRNVSYQHPDYTTYEGCGRSGTEGPVSWSAPWHSYSQQPNTEIVDTDPDPKRLVGTYTFDNGPKQASIKLDLTLEDRADPL